MVEAKDRDGASGGNAATSSLEIKILDVNDNVPVVESSAVSTFMTVLLHTRLCELSFAGEMR